MSEEMNETTTATTRRHYGYWVVAGIAALAMVLGVIAFRNIKRSIISIEQTQKDMSAAGKKLSLEGCIDRVLEWKKMCGAIHVLCRASISRVTAKCLEAQPRQKACVAMDLGKSRGHFSFAMCKKRGMHRRRHWKRECGTAYGTLHKYCQYWKDKSGNGKATKSKAAVKAPVRSVVKAPVRAAVKAPVRAAVKAPVRRVVAKAAKVPTVPVVPTKVPTIPAKPVKVEAKAPAKR